MAGFVDEAQVHVKAGDGGAGAVSFRREAHVAHGGPDGGDGAGGGDVVLEASHDVVSLLSFRDHPHRRAENGTHGSGQKRHGKRGQSLVVFVPEGTVISSLDGAVLADLPQSGDRFVVAQGGRGGRGNARFLTNRRRAPGFAEQGELGEERWLDLELKLVADVALVGFPNAGKSTLISRVSAAKPKIADYPFTTLEPHLGVVRVGARKVSSTDVSEFVIADIPGLIEGASSGRGLGHQFLRHIERARVLVVLLDLVSSEGRSPREQLDILLDELGRYRAELLERPRLVIATKLDAVGGAAIDVEAAGASAAISAVTGDGLRELVGHLSRLVGTARAAEPSIAHTPVYHRPALEGVRIEREGGEFVVLGRDAVRAAALSDLTDADAVEVIWGRLRRLGVDKALARAGVREGDVVRIGKMVFTYDT